MKITINPAIRHVQPFIERLPEVFPVSGEVLHEGRNQIRAFDIGGESLVVKRYKRPHLFNRVMYSFFRKNKARRAYEHALRLRGMGFRHPGTGGMERIPQGRPDRRHLFRLPPVGAHPAPADHATLPGAGHAARARSLRPLHRPPP